MTIFRIALASLLISAIGAEAQTNQSKQMDAAKKRIENVTQHGVVRPSTGTASGYTGPYNYPPKRTSIDRTFVPVPGKPFDQRPHQRLQNPLNAQPAVQRTPTTAPAVQRTTTTAPAVAANNDSASRVTNRSARANHHDHSGAGQEKIAARSDGAGAIRERCNIGCPSLAKKIARARRAILSCDAVV